MGKPETSTVEPVVRKRPSKTEQRVYLDEELENFLDRLRRSKGFRYGSEALRYCILKELARARRRAAKRQAAQPRDGSQRDRQATGTG